MTLALDRGLAWVACKEQSRVVRVDPRTRKTTQVRLEGLPIAVLSAFGSVWAIDSGATLYRIDPRTARVAKRISVGAGAPYNLWSGGGSLWTVDDNAGQVIRLAPSGRVLARLDVGDGPADMVFDGRYAYVINHRDRGLVRIALASNTFSRLATIPGDAPERMAWAGGKLWITGRGTDLLAVDPATGAVVSTVDIGASGIDVVALGGALWVPTRSAAVDPTGFPTMDALRRVSASTRAVKTVARPSGRVDVHGLQAAGGVVWLADNRDGYLYRVKG
jgi:streptogramin lyase